MPEVGWLSLAQQQETANLALSSISIRECMLIANSWLA